MSTLTVTYFDLAGSRGEEVRLALRLAGVPFNDNRIDRASFPALKPELPFGALPVLEVEGRGVFAHSNAILRLIGRQHGLYPEDLFEAARHDAIMEAVEDLRHRISPTMRMDDPAQKALARQQILTDYLPHWGRGVEHTIGDGPFVSGDRPGVADIKLHMVDRWISGGGLDGIPPGSLDAFPKLKAVSGGIAKLRTP